MSPQVGDIWDWQRGECDEDGPVLLVKFNYEESDWGETTSHFLGLELLTGKYDDFIFNNSNMLYWRKVG